MKYTTEIIFILLAGINFPLQAQLKQLPIQRVTPSSINIANSRLQETTAITLPFWDDFSTSSGLIDTTWWMPGSQVQILARPGNGVLPPTINVVTFDGVNAQGNPYSTSDTDGPVDSLVSRPIDLTLVPASLRSSVFLSFFFQVKGLGNQPEPEDSLILYFRKSDGLWQKMWPLAGDIIPQDPTIFTEKLVNVPNDTAFFYDHFQFKFQAIGRQNGWFDNWNLDYIYMDKRRNANDNSYLDRAFTDLPTSILNGYSAMPFNEFVFTGDPSPNLTSSSTWIRTLENDTQPVQFTTIITDTLNNVILDTIANFVELLLFAKDVREAVGNPPDPSVFDLNADSLFLEIKYFANTGDKNLIDSITNAGADTVFYPNINLRVNDTVRSYVTIHDYFAYDDGSAEFGAGINQKDGWIAYQYFTNNEQFLDRIDMYFPNISRDQAGSPMELYVFDELIDGQNDFLGFTTAAIRHDGINIMVTYNFSNPVAVIDTFYIAFRNLSADGQWTAIGLDKNTNTGEKIYYSVDGAWVQNTDIEGSLMMRPHFGSGIVSGIEDKHDLVEIYPNPAVGSKVSIDGRFDNIYALDIMGRVVEFKINSIGDTSQIQFAGETNRLILLIIEKDGKRMVRRILLIP